VSAGLSTDGTVTMTELVDRRGAEALRALIALSARVTG